MNRGYIGEHLCNGKTVPWFFGFVSLSKTFHCFVSTSGTFDHSL